MISKFQVFLKGVEVETFSPLKLAARGLAQSLDIASRRVRSERRAKKLLAKKDSIGGPRGWRRGWINVHALLEGRVGTSACPILLSSLSAELGSVISENEEFDKSSPLSIGAVRRPIRIPTALALRENWSWSVEPMIIDGMMLRLIRSESVL